MTSEHSPRRLNLDSIYRSLATVEDHWDDINNELDRLKIGRKDEFLPVVRDNVFLAYIYLDNLLKRGVPPLNEDTLIELLEINEIIHYGADLELRHEYASAIGATVDQFFGQQATPGRVTPIYNWFKKHTAQDDKVTKLAAEVCMSIVGSPQLFIEGNHRSGNIIANWICAYYGQPIFVLSAENAIAYFAPASEIKHFDKRSAWRGLKLPKYQRQFREFWEKHISQEHLLAPSDRSNY